MKKIWDSASLRGSSEDITDCFKWYSCSRSACAVHSRMRAFAQCFETINGRVCWGVYFSRQLLDRDKLGNGRTGLLISAFFRIASQMRVCLAQREVDSPSNIRLNRSMKSWCTPISVASTESNSILLRQGPSYELSNNTPKPWYLITRSSNWQCKFSSADWWLKTTDRGVCAFF